MPLCQQCDSLDAYEIARQGAPLPFEGSRAIDVKYLTRHHDSLAELGKCVFGQISCDLCELFLLSWLHPKQYSYSAVKDEDKLLGEDKASRLRRFLALRAQNKPDGALYVSASHPPLPERSQFTLPGMFLWQSKSGRDVISGDDKVGKVEFFFERSAISKSIDVDKEYVWARNISEDPSDQASLGLIQEWLKNCLQNHPICQKSLGNCQALPTRVIDVGNGRTNPCLYITDNELGVYTALSYCWGRDANLKLLYENLDRFRECIGFSEFPKTIQDAITLTRAIGIQYLWVDALCIIQELYILISRSSKDDWAYEATRMNKVYKNATLTLFAANSSSAGEGFLKIRDLDPQCSLPWRATGQNTEPSRGSPSAEILNRVFLRMDQSYRHNLDDDFVDWPMGTWPTRGWTLQELLAAGRGLTFTKFQMSWHCLSTVCRENGESFNPQDGNFNTATSILEEGGRPLRLPSYANGWASLIFIKQSKEDQLSLNNYSNVLVDQFYMLTNQYKDRSFTFPSDKLAATAGIAKTVEDLFSARDCPGRYWAGIWDGHLAEGLEWTVSSYDHPDYDRCDEKRQITLIPSWSWASVVSHSYEIDREPPSLDSKERKLGSVIKNAQFLGACNDQERFVPRIQLVLCLTAPFLRLPNDWMKGNCETDGSSRVSSYLGKILRVDLLEIPNAPGEKIAEQRRARSEFGQKHQPHASQQFALIQYSGGQKHVRGRRGQMAVLPSAKFLLLESVPGCQNRYRRVSDLELSSHIHPYVYTVSDGCKLTKSQVLEMIKEDPWLEQEVELV